MKNLNIDSMSVHEMNTIEMQEIEGGFVVILAVCLVALTLPLCTSVNDLGILDISMPAHNTSSGESIDLAKRYDMPFGY